MSTDSGCQQDDAPPGARVIRASRGSSNQYVTFLSDIHPEEIRKSLMKGEDGLDRYVFIGREVYLSCPVGYGRTKFSNTFFEKKLGFAATTRNWNTVNALVEMAG